MKRTRVRTRVPGWLVATLVVAGAALWACDRSEVTLAAGIGAEAETHRVITRVESRDGRSVLVAEVDPSSPWKMNLDFPTALATTAGLEQRLEASDAALHEEAGVRFEVEVHEDLAAVEGTLHFSVCTPQECRFANAPVAWQLENATP